MKFGLFALNYGTCADPEAAVRVARHAEDGVVFESDPVDEGWGIAVKVILPGKVEMLLYQSRHNTAV